MFKKRRGINLSYEKQGLVHFVCVNYEDMPDEVQNKIYNICNEVGKEYADALFKVVTDNKRSIRSISEECHVSEMSLYRYRKRFYEAWYE